jgi:hypothetical protein
MRAMHPSRLWSLGVLGTATSTVYEPAGVRLALTADATKMAVAWDTFDGGAAADSFVDFTPVTTATGAVAEGKATVFHVDPSRKWSVHEATMTGLQAGVQYAYKVGGNSSGWSDVFHFTAATPSAAVLAAGTVQTHLLFGDLGAGCEFSMCPACDCNQTCTAETCAANNTAGLVSELAGGFTMALHVGDFAYDFDGANGTNGDAFMENIQQIAARAPYMVSLGNHENSGVSLAHYTERFRHMPSGPGEVRSVNGRAPNNWCVPSTDERVPASLTVYFHRRLSSLHTPGSIPGMPVSFTTSLSTRRLTSALRSPTSGTSCPRCSRGSKRTSSWRTPTAPPCLG